MFKILIKTLKTGTQTTKYPDIPNITPIGFRGKPKLLSDKCTYCGKCVEVCPSKVIWLNDKVLTLSYCGCIFCGRCEEVCPYGAILLTQEYELASKTKHDLLTVIKRKL